MLPKILSWVGIVFTGISYLSAFSQVQVSSESIRLSHTGRLLIVIASLATMKS
jgi:hypothetical protein